MMSIPKRTPIANVLTQHVDDALSLRSVRSVLVRAPHVKLHQLRRHDDRLLAHLDGLAVARDTGRALVAAALDAPTPAVLFVSTVSVIEAKDAGALDRLLAVAESLPETRPGLTSAFGWVAPSSLRGLTQPLLESASPFQRSVGLSACVMHQVHPAGALEAALSDRDPALRACALRSAGDLGRAELLDACLRATADADPACRFQALRSAVLLGRHQTGLDGLPAIALTPGQLQQHALNLLLRIGTLDDAQATMKSLAGDAASARLLVRAAGISGNAQLLPWLLDQMAVPALARLAAESFTMITGADLALLDWELMTPAPVTTGPTDDPLDERVALDEDESLPWPDIDKLSAWWTAHGQQFSPGTRYFMGKAPSLAHCVDVLRNGGQRQRTAASIWLGLLQPGTPRFNTAAPAARQQRALGPKP